MHLPCDYFKHLLSLSVTLPFYFLEDIHNLQFYLGSHIPELSYLISTYLLPTISTQNKNKHKNKKYPKHFPFIFFFHFNHEIVNGGMRNLSTIIKKIQHVWCKN